MVPFENEISGCVIVVVSSTVVPNPLTWECKPPPPPSSLKLWLCVFFGLGNNFQDFSDRELPNQPTPYTHNPTVWEFRTKLYKSQIGKGGCCPTFFSFVQKQQSICCGKGGVLVTQILTPKPPWIPVQGYLVWFHQDYLPSTNWSADP